MEKATVAGVHEKWRQIALRTAVMNQTEKFFDVAHGYLVLASNPSLLLKDRIVTAGLSSVAQLNLTRNGDRFRPQRVAGLRREDGRFGPEYAGMSRLTRNRSGFSGN